MSKYDFKIIEPKWQKKWEEQELYKAEDNSPKPKKYILDMFPYPSGSGLHVGHVESYTATDIYSRFMRLKGYNVLHPQGWDAFGLPAENYAIKTGIHPTETTKEAIKTFTKQINSLGFSYDWSREVNSSDPAYYKWTQWLFLLFYKNGLAYKKKAKVNWCESCQTVLANEQAEGGVCDRCGNKVIQKDLEQWFFKITDFIEDQVVDNNEVKGLLNGLSSVDWPDSTKAAQKNWIGRSEGSEIKFSVGGYEPGIKVFTTRVDTIFGCTYVVVAPEHPLLKELGKAIKNIDEVEAYVAATKKKTDLDRMEAKEKSGVELKGIKTVNPFNGNSVSVYVADYVLGSYGTGAVMAVPAHDERDFEFAKKYNLQIKESIISNKGSKTECYTDDGQLVDSGEFTGKSSAEARELMMQWLEKNLQGSRKVNYKLRDWLISRQRYWGAPIPIIYCEKCGEVPVPEKDLPVLLPTDVDFKPTGESPLMLSKTFHEVICPVCGIKAKRESDTMDTFVCSSWYYLRYADNLNDQEFASQSALKQWLPVDVYLGGAEHTVLHLLYARFFTKALQKFGLVDFNEPFLKLRHQGTILAEDGTKMSKSKGNVVNPDVIVEQYGADALRIYEMFMGPLEDAKPWNTKGIVGITRFLEKAWKLATEKTLTDCEVGVGQCNCAPVGLPQLLHKTIKKVTEDIEEFRFNTAISQMMIFVNFASKFDSLPKPAVEKFLKILSPFAPHMAEELWSLIGNNESIFLQKWPEYNGALIRDELVNLVVQINGKVRETIEVEAGITEEAAQKIALEQEKIKPWLENKEIIKVIFVPDKLINIVVK
ncbi:MAG: Leucine-tRNA ligase [Parcubacteria group bacterium GW2011_GWE2_39_37]|nr:MAG: Leucine-tRNA ligase [Parcubacteria group bacterium GW2011_GWE2_39_37]